MYVMQISKHTPESCPMVNERNKKVTVALLGKMESLAAKHGIKFIGSWTDFPMHIINNIFDAPNMEAYVQFSMEPEMMAWLGFNTVESKMVLSQPEVRTMLKMK